MCFIDTAKAQFKLESYFDPVLPHWLRISCIKLALHIRQNFARLADQYFTFYLGISCSTKTFGTKKYLPYIFYYDDLYHLKGLWR